MRKTIEILLFFEISWIASFSLLEGGGEVTGPHPTRSTSGGVRVVRGYRGAGVQRGGNAAEDFLPF